MQGEKDWLGSEVSWAACGHYQRTNGMPGAQASSLHHRRRLGLVFWPYTKPQCGCGTLGCGRPGSGSLAGGGGFGFTALTSSGEAEFLSHGSWLSESLRAGWAVGMNPPSVRPPFPGPLWSHCLVRGSWGGQGRLAWPPWGTARRCGCQASLPFRPSPTLPRWGWVSWVRRVWWHP